MVQLLFQHSPHHCCWLSSWFNIIIIQTLSKWLPGVLIKAKTVATLLMIHLDFTIDAVFH